MKANNQLRIIGGEWRGRKLSFLDLPGLRPTSDRVRETLFNWLQSDIAGANCLDLYAGSGALGFEALSRGAEHVVFVDSHVKVIEQIKQNAQRLLIKKERVDFLVSDAHVYLEKISASAVVSAMASTKACIDLVFLDPPFHQNLLQTSLQLLATLSILKPHAKVYVEVEVALDESILPDEWIILKAKKAGSVHYYLLAQQ